MILLKGFDIWKESSRVCLYGDPKEAFHLTNVQPFLEYACPAWDPQIHNLVNGLEHIQVCTAHFINNNYNFA